jgi:hypothetical protein
MEVNEEDWNALVERVEELERRVADQLVLIQSATITSGKLVEEFERLAREFPKIVSTMGEMMGTSQDLANRVDRLVKHVDLPPEEEDDAWDRRN